MSSRWRIFEGPHVYLRQQLVNWAQYPCKRGSFIQAEQACRLNILSQQREIPQSKPSDRTVDCVDLTFYLLHMKTFTSFLHPQLLNCIELFWVKLTCAPEASYTSYTVLLIIAVIYFIPVLCCFQCEQFDFVFFALLWCRNFYFPLSLTFTPPLINDSSFISPPHPILWLLPLPHYAPWPLYIP